MSSKAARSKEPSLSPTTPTPTPAPTPAAERILIRLDPPVEGVECQPITYLRQADGAQVYANRRLEYTWLRSRVQRTCEEPACTKQREAATLQDLVTGKRYCSKPCMQQGFRALTTQRMMQLMSLEGDGGGGGEVDSSPFRYSDKSQVAIVDYDENDHLVWDCKPFVEDAEWVEVSRAQTYVPTSLDVGHVLKCVISAYSDQQLSTPTVTNTSDETPVVIGPPPPPPKRRLVQCHPQQFLLHPHFQDANNFQFRVVTYNILADIYATTQMFPYCPKWALSWRYRRVQIMRELVAYDADVICLQEVQQDQFQQYLLPLFENLGYEGLYKAKTRESSQTGKIDGCATLFRRSKFSLLQQSYYEIEYNKAAHQMANQGAFASTCASSSSSSSTKTSSSRNQSSLSSSGASGGGGASSSSSSVQPPNDAATQACLKRLCKDNVAHVCILQGVNPHTGELSQICVANTHMFWDPDYPDVKLWQAHYLLQELEGIAGSRMLPLVLCGDFNSTAESAVYEFLAEERVKPDHIDLSFDKVGILPDASQLTHTLGLASAVHLVTGQEPELTTFTQAYQGTLDYIWLNEALTAVSMLEMPNEPALRALEDSYMPSSLFPSDHIAICVDLRLADLHSGGSLHHQHGAAAVDDFY